MCWWWSGLTETKASVTLVMTEGRREWSSSLCSVRAKTRSVTAFSGARVKSRADTLPPLSERERERKKKEKVNLVVKFKIYLSEVPERERGGHRLAQDQTVMRRQLSIHTWT